MSENNTASVQERLLNIQSELTVPKNQEGRFGKHRNVESILAALNPLLKKHGLTLTLDNKMVVIGNNIYAEATATVSDAKGDAISVDAQAWEGEISRGLDAPQVTGSATSYARKYALGGLFAIDDGTADPDAHKEAAPSKPVIRKATGPQKFQLQKLMKEKGIDEADQMTMFVESVIGKARVDTEVEFLKVKEALEEEAEK